MGHLPMVSLSLCVLLFTYVEAFRPAFPVARSFATSRTKTFMSDNNADQKIGVVLLNMGGPDTLDDVEPFLFNLFNDPQILTLPKPLQPFRSLLARMISRKRAPIAQQGYASIGGGSPLRRITTEQGSALEEALAAAGVSAKVYVAMRYSHPFSAEAVAAMAADGIEKLVVLPLYPQFSSCTTGSSLAELAKHLTLLPAEKRPANVAVKEWYANEGYIESLTDSIEEKLQDAPRGAHVVFSAHGVPVQYIKNGDPYQKQMESCVELVIRNLRARGYGNEYSLSYQSKVGPVEWLKPSTSDTLVELGEAGTEGVVMVPISFVSEHIETLEEMDVEYREVAEESGIKAWSRADALGTRPSFIKALSAMVLDALLQVAQAPSTDEEGLNIVQAGLPLIAPRPAEDEQTRKVTIKIKAPSFGANAQHAFIKKRPSL